MRRTERLFQIIQILRSARKPVTGQELASELEVSLRTLYRDMVELIAQRVPIRGEAGMGYVLDAGYDMPPLMLTPDELEAAVLGAAWVAKRADPSLARGARDLVAKLSAAIPELLRPVLLDPGLMPIAGQSGSGETFDVAQLRAAIRQHRKATIEYATDTGPPTTRTIWPILVGYTDVHRIVAAWCELRNGFRHFRTDRITEFVIAEAKIPERMDKLRSRWAAEHKYRRKSDVAG